MGGGSERVDDGDLLGEPGPGVTLGEIPVVGRQRRRAGHGGRFVGRDGPHLAGHPGRSGHELLGHVEGAVGRVRRPDAHVVEIGIHDVGVVARAVHEGLLQAVDSDVAHPDVLGQLLPLGRELVGQGGRVPDGGGALHVARVRPGQSDDRGEGHQRLGAGGAAGAVDQIDEAGLVGRLRGGARRAEGGDSGHDQGCERAAHGWDFLHRARTTSPGRPVGRSRGPGRVSISSGEVPGPPPRGPHWMYRCRRPEA